MLDDKEKPSDFPLISHIRKTAKLLRDAVKLPGKVERSYTKDTDIGPKNRIERIARMLREEAKKK